MTNHDCIDVSHWSDVMYLQEKKKTHSNANHIQYSLWQYGPRKVWKQPAKYPTHLPKHLARRRGPCCSCLVAPSGSPVGISASTSCAHSAGPLISKTVRTHSSGRHSTAHNDSRVVHSLIKARKLKRWSRSSRVSNLWLSLVTGINLAFGIRACSQSPSSSNAPVNQTIGRLRDGDDTSKRECFSIASSHGLWERELLLTHYWLSSCLWVVE